MRVKENITLYICEHCKKRYEVKPAAERHELYCFRNPANFHACFKHCKHLIKDKEKFDEDPHGGWATTDMERVSFQCAITKQFMYSFVAERRNCVPVYNDWEEDREYIRMPLECEHYEYGENLPF